MSKLNVQFADKAVKSYDKNKIKTALVASRMVYDLDNTREGFLLVKKWDTPKTGLQAALYDTNLGYVLAFAGSNDAADWYTNIRHATGLSADQHDQIDNLIKEACSLVNSKGGKLNIITGHSLGGSLATLAAISISDFDPENLVVFNPEYLHENYFKKIGNNNNKDEYFDNANIWQVKGEPLAVVQFGASIFAELPFIDGLYRFPRINVVSLNAPNISALPSVTEAIGRINPLKRHQLDVLEKYFRDNP
jgi:hypothetical protein